MLKLATTEKWSEILSDFDAERESTSPFRENHKIKRVTMNVGREMDKKVVTGLGGLYMLRILRHL